MTLARRLEEMRRQYHRQQSVINQAEVRIGSTDLNDPDVWFAIAEALVKAGYKLCDSDHKRYIALVESKKRIHQGVMQNAS